MGHHLIRACADRLEVRARRQPEPVLCKSLLAHAARQDGKILTVSVRAKLATRRC
jgi:hypothetical protein